MVLSTIDTARNHSNFALNVAEELKKAERKGPRIDKAFSVPYIYTYIYIYVYIWPTMVISTNDIARNESNLALDLAEELKKAERKGPRIDKTFSVPSFKKKGKNQEGQVRPFTSFSPEFPGDIRRLLV